MPDPRLILLPVQRVCACGKILGPRERSQGCCDVCRILDNHLPKLQPQGAASLS